MKRFCNLFARIDQTQSTNEKVQYMQEYFLNSNPKDAVWALFLLTGQRFKRLISSLELRKWYLEYANFPTWLMDECYAGVGDTAETIALLIQNREHSETDESLSSLMENQILPLAKLSKEAKKEAIISTWQKMSSNEVFIFNKILTGSFRVGVSKLLTIKALEGALGVSKELLHQRLMGEWKPTCEFYDSLKEQESGKKYLNPYPFFLASPIDEGQELESLGEPTHWLAEWKWDGIRAQAICRHGHTALWSRGNELISVQFPELIDAISKLPDGTVVDGEILAYKDNSPLPFNSLQRRLGRKKPSKTIQAEVPCVIMMYDLLELDHIDWRMHPLSERQQALRSLALLDTRLKVSEFIAFASWEDIRTLRLQAKRSFTEGIMLKEKASSYGLGRQRGSWWKYKVDPMTIDAVLLYAQAGSGRRANLFTDYTFGVWHNNELIPIAKAYSGLSQSEIEKLDKWIRKNTIQKFGPVRHVVAEQVFELAFEGIQHSPRHKSGIALRFPRIVRWRHDKPKDECDTLEQIKQNFLHE